jgi:hypothetical protein
MKYKLSELGLRVYSEFNKRGITLRELTAAIGSDYNFTWSTLHGQDVSAPLEMKIKKYFKWE